MVLKRPRGPKPLKNQNSARKPYPQVAMVPQGFRMNVGEGPCDVFAVYLNVVFAVELVLIDCSLVTTYQSPGNPPGRPSMV